MSRDLAIRAAERRDADALGRLGALLMRAHYAFERLGFRRTMIEMTREAGVSSTPTTREGDPT
jgi:hypothetical protein